MRSIPTSLPDVLLLEPQVHGDARGFFIETYNRRVLASLGIHADFVQDNHSLSVRNVLRGLHYQVRRPQGKLVRVVTGVVYDVAVDVRRGSPSFGRWVGFELSAQNRRLCWIPPGFAHGFLVLSEVAELVYKTTDYYAPEHERAVAWNDPAIGIEWPLTVEPILSDKDRRAARLAVADVDP
jgi:dTDP-4-dehydrorhamnose 3,5-epimerase